MSRHPGRNHRVRGQAVPEFALVAPIFFLLLFGVIEAGRLVFFYEALSNATRAGARYAIVHGSNSACPSGPMPGTLVNICDPAADNVRAAVRDAAFGIVGTGDFDELSVTYPEANGRGDQVTVVARYTYVPLMPVLPSFTISAESTLVVNN